MGELAFMLGLQIKQCEDDIFISQEKYARELVKKFGLENVNIAKTPMAHNALLDLDEKVKMLMNVNIEV